LRKTGLTAFLENHKEKVTLSIFLNEPKRIKYKFRTVTFLTKLHGNIT
jgi:hypothetical protein